MDAISNFAYSTVATPPSLPSSGTSLVVQSGDGLLFPATPFDLLLWPVGTNPTKANAEIAICTLVSTDTLTITRAQYGTNARTVLVGDQCGQPIDSHLLDQLAALNPGIQQTMYDTRVTPRGLTLSSQTGSGPNYQWTGSTLTFNTDFYNVIELTAQASNFTIGNPSGSPTVAVGESMRIEITDSGTSRTLGWGSKFESGGCTLPGNTLGGGGSPICMDIQFVLNSVTGNWRCVAVSPQAGIVVQDSTNWFPTASTPVTLTTSNQTIFDPTLTQGNWLILAVMTVSSSGATTAGTKVNAAVESGTGYVVQTPSGHPAGNFLKLPVAAQVNAGPVVIVAWVTVTSGTATVQISATATSTANIAQVAASDGTVFTNTEESVCWCIPMG